MKKVYLQLIFLTLGTTLLLTSFSPKPTPTLIANSTYPNFVFILADDMGWNGTSVQLMASEIASASDFYETPNLEQLAVDGMVFSQAYAPAPKCSPSRNSILTGQTTARNQHTETGQSGVVDKILLDAPNSNNIDLADVTIGEWLHALNVAYQTAHYGKWHLNSGGTILDNGFDTGDGDTNNNEGTAPDGMTTQVDPKGIAELTTNGMDFMEQSVMNNQPFYLQLSHYAVHTPLEATDSSLTHFGTKPVGAVHTNVEFAAMTRDLDASIGQLLQKVEDLGIASNTYIIFMSDNGAATGQSPNGVLSRGKSFLTEGGIRVPMIVKGPSIPAGVQCDNSVVGYDIFPTIAAMSGGTIPLPPNLDGQSILPLLQQTNFTRNEPLYFHSPHYGGASKNPRAAIIDQNFKFVVQFDNCEEFLYDFNTSLSERNQFNIISSDPDKAFEMKIKLRDYLKSVNANMPSMNPAYALYAGNGGTTTDVDADGLNDVWEIQELMCPLYDATDDPDGDGRDNATEEAENTDPLIYTNVLDIKAVLQGAYNSSPEMRTDLQDAGVLPLNDPYGLGESVINLPPDMVDWVKLEFRDPSNTNTILMERACFLHKNGYIYDLDGKRGLRLERLEFSSAHLVLRHRNHLGVMLENTTTFQ